jgi:carboxylate-amine ligase
LTTDSLTFGVEEEFLVVDAETGALVPRSDAVLPHAQAELGDAVSGELNLCQIEVETPVCSSLEDVRGSLVRLRRGLLAGAARARSRVLAVGTHPSGMWQDQRVDRRRERYERMEERYQVIARQQVICGCHVHVGIPDRDLGVAAMNRMRPWLPVLLALSANSPFWQGADTGYASFRLQVWRRWPTSGMPPTLASDAEYKQVIADLEAIEAIEDATFLYWYVRPSARYPTLELRACDVCPDVDDTVALAGLSRALVWTCLRETMAGVADPTPRLEVLDAAMWFAARWGLEGGLVSPGQMAVRPAREVVGELLEYVRDGLEAHGDREETSALVETILRRGNGATRQRAALARRDDTADVVRWALDATAAGTGFGEGQAGV